MYGEQIIDRLYLACLPSAHRKYFRDESRNVMLIQSSKMPLRCWTERLLTRSLRLTILSLEKGCEQRTTGRHLYRINSLISNPSGPASITLGIPGPIKQSRTQNTNNLTASQLPSLINIPNESSLLVYSHCRSYLRSSFLPSFLSRKCQNDSCKHHLYLTPSWNAKLPNQASILQTHGHPGCHSEN